ncbi:MAG: FkbM family methyltransferase [Mesorhizobium sp.]|uniref:FkbM family methyltransferase n=1 Tax=Mesorhizobium sp. TaxID=1871066 RepID=UPI000FEAA37C|nr:FkbM family methyltransferase [Mesorhizobium sp.]RWN60800.1 MAG: FkbM family methyltransferase [Mesorhizobium sp.]RWO31129.1 MAG: FkbM family methyltransferase [Mesorhizobium sp.]TIL81133.1 MAG: FkbM family methyltransferase [Mesorhizobium sp.]TIM41001.1 MAG: FkbM family methyltransferase [Mesorhizobium sp.]
MSSKAMRRFRGASGIVVSPLLYLASRLTHSQRVLEASIAADNRNFRAVSDRLRGRNPAFNQLIAAAQFAAALGPEDAETVKQLLPRAEGQLLQDVFCLLANKEKREGYFVEVGVGAGRKISNTYLLETGFGWNGILVEPNVSSHESIRAERRVILETRAAASKSGMKLKFEEVIGNGEHSRVANTGGHPVRADAIRSYTVETVTLNEILSQNSAPNRIDFLSLDTEGSELDILAGLDFDKYVFHALAIEHNYNQATLAALRAMLIPLGYKQVFREVSDFDAWFVHASAPNTFTTS